MILFRNAKFIAHIVIFTAHVMLFPYCVEASFSEVSEVATKFLDSDFVLVVTLDKNVSRDFSFVCDAFESGQLFNECVSETQSRRTEGISAMDIDGSKRADKPNAKCCKYYSIFNEYLVQSGALGFLAWIPLLRLLFGSPNVLNTATQTAPALCLLACYELRARFGVAGYSLVRRFLTP